MKDMEITFGTLAMMLERIVLNERGVINIKIGDKSYHLDDKTTEVIGQISMDFVDRMEDNGILSVDVENIERADGVAYDFYNMQFEFNQPLLDSKQK